MNWKRIGIYVAVLFLATALAVFPFGFLVAVFNTRGQPVPRWVAFGPMICVPLAAIFVFIRLSIIQYEKTLSHVLTVAFIAWLLSFPFNVIMFKQSPLQWASGGIFLALPTLLGWLIGQCFQKPPGVSETKKDLPKGKENRMSQKQLEPQELLLAILGMVVGIVLALSITILFLPRNIILFMVAGAIGGAGGSFVGGKVSKLIKKKA